MKSRNRLSLDEALELCGEMLLDGWEKLQEQFADNSHIQFPYEEAA